MCMCGKTAKVSLTKTDDIIRDVFAILEENNYVELRRKYFSRDTIFALVLNNSGFTLFLLSVIEHRKELLEMLLSNDSRRKALLAQRDIYGNTGLHLATHMGDKEIAGYLLMQGADRDAKNNAGETALDIAKIRGNADMARLFQPGQQNLREDSKQQPPPPVETATAKEEPAILMPRTKVENVKEIDVSVREDSKAAGGRQVDITGEMKGIDEGPLNPEGNGVMVLKNFGTNVHCTRERSLE